jgi:enoyl-CoA hydratase
MNLETGTPRLLAQCDGAIGRLIFNHPERRNALSLDMWQAIPNVLAAFEADPAVRVVVFSGAGEQAFVSGADISQFADKRADQAADAQYSAISGAATRALETLSKPSIAMIRGFCIGGGLAVALSCDLRIASEDARFAIPAARLGLGYRFEGVRKLVGVVGPACASEILFTARQFNAAEALQMGLLNRVVTVDELAEVVRAQAELIAQNAPLTLRASKLAIKAALQDPERRDLHELSRAIEACFASEDYAEGRRAFMEKRKPKFSGR